MNVLPWKYISLAVTKLGCFVFPLSHDSNDSGQYILYRRRISMPSQTRDTPYNGLYGKAPPKKWYLVLVKFHSLKSMKGYESVSFWSVKDPRKLSGYSKSVLFWLKKKQTVHLQQLHGMQRSKLGRWQGGYHLSIIGIPTKKAPFLSKMVNKEVMGWTAGWILPLQNLLSVPPPPLGY